MSPIKPENKGRYPEDWPGIALAIKERAGWRCECEGECGVAHGLGPFPDGDRCHKRHGFVYPGFFRNGAKCVLTVAHLDHAPENCEPENLKAMCQGCHLRYDAPRKKTERIAARAGSEPLFETETA